MSYKKAEQILPAGLLKEVQKYAEGEYIYIPKNPSSKFAWLNNNNRTIEISFLIHIVNNPVNESTQEVSFTKLNNAFRILSSGEIATI